MPSLKMKVNIFLKIKDKSINETIPSLLLSIYTMPVSIYLSNP